MCRSDCARPGPASTNPPVQGHLPRSAHCPVGRAQLHHRSHWRGMFNKQYGLINQTLEAFGVEGIAWFSNFWTAFMANVTTNTWRISLYDGGESRCLAGIPRDLYEAAEVDGANRWQQFVHITVPMLKPALAPAIILGGNLDLQYVQRGLSGRGGMPDGSTDILITEAYRWAFEQDRYGFAAAYSLVIFVILVGYSIITNKVTGATKGPSNMSSEPSKGQWKALRS